MAHLIARHPESGEYLHREHPDFHEHAEEISGELRRVRLFNAAPRNGLQHEVIDHVPVEHVKDYVAAALSNAGRDIEAGDRAWDYAEVGDVHDAGPGGDLQHWHDDGTTPAPPTTSTSTGV